MQHWKPGPIWSSKTAVVVAGGPSFTAADARLIGMAQARNQVKVITVNDAVYPCWFTDIAWASDDIWWRLHRNLPGFDGLRLGLRHIDGSSWRQPSEIDYLEASGVDGYDPRFGHIRHGGNGRYAAVHIAAQLGAARIILVGFDMTGETDWAHRFSALAEDRQDSVEIINTSMSLGLTGIRKAPLNTILKA